MKPQLDDGHCFHRLFEMQADDELVSGLVAIESDDTVFTYKEVNHRANRLAHHLIDLGVGPEIPVGVSIQRSPDMFVAMLAIAKAGGAYVPLDPGEREYRRALMIEDSDLRFFVTDRKQQLQLSPKRVIVDLSANSDVIAAMSNENPLVRVALRNLAYLIYTSGSTGRPKGTAMEHGALANLMQWHGAIYQTSSGLRTLQFCSTGFDFSFHEIFATLCFGGTLVMASDEARHDPFILARFVRERKIEKLFLPVSALLQWAAVVGETSFPGRLKHVITTGEQLQITPALRALFDKAGAQLHNHWGATEFQDATTLTLSGDPASWPDFPAIGRPLAKVGKRS